jgi:hypothetical protein
VKALRLDRDEASLLTSILLVDDQHVFTDGAGVQIEKSYAKPTPGRCPTLTLERWKPIGSWQAAFIRGFSDTDDGGGSVAWTVVCDPASGRLLRVQPEGSVYTHYCTTTDDTPRAAALGPWLVLERRSTEFGGYCGGPTSIYTALVIDTQTGQISPAAGGIAGPGATARTPALINGAPAPPGIADYYGTTPSVVVRDGALAWVAQVQGGLEVYLADAAGTRVVGRATGKTLSLDDTLRWTEDDIARTAAVSPDESWKAAATVLRTP